MILLPDWPSLLGGRNGSDKGGNLPKYRGVNPALPRRPPCR
jgi:hypothetical protein